MTEQIDSLDVMFKSLLLDTKSLSSLCGGAGMQYIYNDKQAMDAKLAEADKMAGQIMYTIHMIRRYA